MEKGWPGSLVQVPDVKCLIWNSTPSQSFKRHPVAIKEIAGLKELMRKETPEKAVLAIAKGGSFALLATPSVGVLDPIRPSQLLPDPGGFLSLCDLEQATLPSRPGSPTVK